MSCRLSKKCAFLTRSCVRDIALHSLRAQCRLQPTIPNTLTVKVAGVFLRLQVRDELGFLPQQGVPVQLCEEGVLLHLERTAW